MDKITRGYDQSILLAGKQRPPSATSIVQFERCEFSFFCNKIGGERTPPNEAMAAGTMVHKMYELITQRLSPRYCALNKDIPEGFIAENIAIIQDTIEEVKNGALHDYPQYEDKLLNSAIDTERRLIAKEQTRVLQTEAFLKAGIKGTELANKIWPTMVEKKIMAWPLGLQGIIDEVYVDGNLIVPSDIKTGNGFLQKENKSRALQLTTYALLLEFQQRTPVNSGRIHHANILYEEEINISQELRLEVLKIRDAILQMMKDKEAIDPASIEACGICDYCETFGRARRGDAE